MTKKEWEKFEKALAKAAGEEACLTDEEWEAILESIEEIEVEDKEEDAVVVFGSRKPKDASILYIPKKDAATH